MIQLTLALKMTTAQVVETSVTVKLNVLKWLLGSNLSQFFLCPTHRALIFIDEVYMTEISVNVLLALSKRGCTKKYIQLTFCKKLCIVHSVIAKSLYTRSAGFYSTVTANAHVFFVWDSCKINQLDKNISRYCCHLLCWSSKSFPLKLKGSFFIPGASFLLFHAKTRQLQWDKFQK